VATGPTKSGKSVLCRRALGNGKIIAVEGGQIRSEADFWNHVAFQLNIASTASRSRADTSTTSLGGEAGGGIPGILQGKGSLTESALRATIAKRESNMADQKPFPGVAEFLFGAPLYEVFHIAYSNLAQYPKTFRSKRFTSDGYSIKTLKSMDTERTSGGFSDDGWIRFHSQGVKYEDDLVITCARKDSHTIWYILRAGAGALQKVGQFPSFADIANDESKQYRTLLSP
jgi:hypothetical protein